MGAALALLFALQVAAADVRVVDGDTIDVGPRGGDVVRYRVLGVDAPELSGRCLAERRLAALASAEVRRLIDAAGGVEIEETGRVQPATERYRRERREAAVRVGGVDLGELLEEAGLAQPWNGRSSWCR